MGKSNKKLADSVALQLLSMCNGNVPLMGKAQIVKLEFDRVRAVDELISNQPQLMLNKVLHSTRAMDTGMRTFLELYGAMPAGQYAMGPYLSQLRRGKDGCFGYPHYCRTSADGSCRRYVVAYGQDTAHCCRYRVSLQVNDR